MADNSPIAVLHRFYEAERAYMLAGGAAGGASFDAFASVLSPTMLLHQSPDLPWGGEYAGIEGFSKWAAQMGETFSEVDVQDAQYMERKDEDGKGGKVIVNCTLRTRSRHTGEEMRRPMIQVITVLGGKITDFRPFYWHVPDYVKAYKGEKVNESLMS